MLRERLDELVSQGRAPRPESKEYKRLSKEIVPPYNPGKFPNKWRKMWRDQPARTFMAHLGKDSYSHTHYDSSQARTISVREAARLQSFPDGFIFCGTMNPAFRQIGNSILYSVAFRSFLRRSRIRFSPRLLRQLRLELPFAGVEFSWVKLSAEQRPLRLGQRRVNLM
jgi:hypothetical protein